MSFENTLSKNWELSAYEKHRTPQEAITDSNTLVSVNLQNLHAELMCPICLDILKSTMTTKECLHRFCEECISTALRQGNRECPTCRNKLISKRSLRRDPNFDALIAKIFPSREEYEAHQAMLFERMNKQQQLRSGSNLKINFDNPNERRSRSNSVDGDSLEPVQEVDIRLAPLSDSIDSKFLKTNEQATVGHLCQYLEIRENLSPINPAHPTGDDGRSSYNMFVKTDTGLLKLESQVTLEKIVAKHFFGVRQVQLYYEKKA